PSRRRQPARRWPMTLRVPLLAASSSPLQRACSLVGHGFSRGQHAATDTIPAPPIPARFNGLPRITPSGIRSPAPAPRAFATLLVLLVIATASIVIVAIQSSAYTEAM